MKILGLMVLLFSFTIQGYSQEKTGLSRKEIRKIAKEEKTAQRVIEQEQLKKSTKLILENKKFVLEANYISNGKGRKIPVSSNLNFIRVDSTKAIMQIGSIQGNSGYNGVGGITVEGRITQYKLTASENKKSTNYSLDMLIISPSGIFNITLLVNEIGTTMATVRNNSINALEYFGNIVSTTNSNTYKGNTRY
jgi:hypothetical protein